MTITKAIITEVLQNNKFLVRIPLFESAGNLQQVIIPATLSYQPGNISGYKEGDVVFVTFENSELSNPVIIGKLYLGEEKETKGLLYDSNLKITDRAILPKNTSIGNFSGEQISAILNKVSSDEFNELFNLVVELKKNVKKTYIFDPTKNPLLNSTDETIFIKTDLIDTSGDTITVDDVNIGDTFYINDSRVPNRWVNDVFYVNQGSGTDFIFGPYVESEDESGEIIKGYCLSKI